MKYLHLRHATGILSYGDLNFLIDPMLSEKEANPPIRNSWNNLRNPLVAFPIPATELPPYTHCLVTHLHSDHFDIVAGSLIPKDIPLICQCEDRKAFLSMAFESILPIRTNLAIGDVKVQRVPGQHGRGVTTKLMGTSSGYIFTAPDEPTVYLTGDTIYYEALRSTLETYQPEIVIAYGGAAQFSNGCIITLSSEDILKIHEQVPKAHIICVHMDAINHCKTTRVTLRKYLEDAGIDLNQFYLPLDGELLDFSQNRLQQTQ